MKNYLQLMLILLLGISCNQRNSNRLASPNNKLVIELEEGLGNLLLTATYKSDTIFSESPLGWSFNPDQNKTSTTIASISKSSKDETWTAINGKNKAVRNQYNEYLISLKNSAGETVLYDILIRCYDMGFAYRYVFQEPYQLQPQGSETSRLKLSQEYTWWSYNGENHNLGPLESGLSGGQIIRPPMVIETASKQYVAILEGAIFDQAPFNLSLSENGQSIGFNFPASTQEPQQTSWRCFILGDGPGDLVESDLLVNLNEPCQIEQTDWILPGKCMWDWRVWGYQTDDGFEYGLNTESHKRFIDFAADNNIQYLLIDADWYGEEFSENSDPTTTRAGIDIVDCMAHAKAKGIGVILYLNDVGAKKFGLERVLKQFADWGAVGVKYGFMRGTPEDKVRHTREVVERCAKYQLMVNFHDNPVPPSGDRRTWPNLMTKEFCHSQADAKRSYFPETAVTAPFVNGLAGPLDQCEGWFGLNQALSRVKVFEEIPGTVAAEVAKLIVNYSGWRVLPDAPEEYLKKADLFECIRNMPAQFDSYQVIDGQIGEFIIVARKTDDQWFIGSLTNRDAREIELHFDFLPDGTNFKATLYEDHDESHFLNNKEAYRIRQLEINNRTILKVKLAPGGGHSVHLVPASTEP